MIKCIHRLMLPFLSTVGLIGLISGCSHPLSSTPAPSQSCGSDSRVVKHVIGETMICGQPQTIAVLDPKALSLMLPLDVQPAAYAETGLLRLPKFDNPSEQIFHLGQYLTTQPINLGTR